MGTEKLHCVYATQMDAYPYGLALYDPSTNDVIKPAAAGYFDANGLWNPLLQLDNLNASDIGYFGPVLPKPEKAPPSTATWGPLYSIGKKTTGIDLTCVLDGSLAGLPIGGGPIFQNVVSKDSGAILLTEGEVVRHRYYHDYPFQTWCETNAKALLKRWPILRDHGFWVITGTYSTPKCRLVAWAGREGVLAAGIQLGAVAAAEITPTAGISTTTEVLTWKQHGPEVLPCEQGCVHELIHGHVQDAYQVVFVTGLHFRYTWRRSLKEVRHPAYRGSETIYFENKGDGYFEVECKVVGNPVDDEQSALQKEIDMLSDDEF